MSVIWGSAWTRQNWWKIGLLVIAGWTGFYIAVIAPMQYERGIAEQRATGLGAVGWEPRSLWAQRSPFSMARKARVKSRLVSPEPVTASMGYIGGVVGGVPGQVLNDQAPADRMIVRTSSLELEVKSPTDAAEKIRTLAERMGGFMVGSEMSGNQYGPGATITIRVPAARFEEARAEIKKLATRIESEKTEANDVTKDYVDRQARLRNLRAQEQQYLVILKRAATIKDTLEVSDKLNATRATIEEQQAEFEALSKQVETVAITVLLRAEADTQVLGIHWRPLYELKVAARDGLDSLANYVGSMVVAIFQLPAVILWIATVILVAVIGWRILRWVGRSFFASRKPAAASPLSS